MQWLCWRLIDLLSRVLDPAEREAVRGDLVESGETPGRALAGVLALVLRRQAEVWTGWRPWLVLLGLALPLGVLLSRLSRHTADRSAVYFWLYANNWEMTYVTNPGFRLDLMHDGGGILTQYFWLACCSWTGGFVLGRVSQRTFQINAAAFGLMLFIAGIYGSPTQHAAWHAAVFSLAFYDVAWPVITQTLLVLLPGLWGMSTACRRLYQAA